MPTQPQTTTQSVCAHTTPTTAALIFESNTYSSGHKGCRTCWRTETPATNNPRRTAFKQTATNQIHTSSLTHTTHRPNHQQPNTTSTQLHTRTPIHTHSIRIHCPKLLSMMPAGFVGRRIGCCRRWCEVYTCCHRRGENQCCQPKETNTAH